MFERVGEGTDVVAQGDVRLRGQGRPPPRAAPRGHRLGGPGVRPAPPGHAVEGLVRHAELPVRAARRPVGYRQHHQVGVECIGSADPDVDVEVIALGHAYLRRSGLQRLAARPQLMGTPADRTPLRRGVLQKWLREAADADARRRRQGRRRTRCGCSTPSGDETRAVLADAPRMVDHLDAAMPSPTSSGCRPGCAPLGIAVRDRRRRSSAASTTTRTPVRVPELARSSTAQATIGGGGRYDGLVEQLGGPPTPGIGFGAGIERVLLTCDAEGVFGAPESTVDVLRRRRHRRRAWPSSSRRPARGGRARPTGRSTAGRMKSQMKAADRSRRPARADRRRATRRPRRHRHDPRPGAGERAPTSDRSRARSIDIT